MWHEVISILFPATCPGCGRWAEPICARCAASLRRPSPHPPPAGIDAWVVAFEYEGPARELVARVKYRNTRAAIPWLGSAIAATVRQRRIAEDVDVVTWAPTTAVRRRARGFDHAELLARAVARNLVLPVRRLLHRRSGTAQTGLSATQRRVGPVFECCRPLPGRLRVLVVDDVATTGATLRATAAVLRAAGASTVVAAVAARTPGPGR